MRYNIVWYLVYFLFIAIDILVYILHYILYFINRVGLIITIVSYKLSKLLEEFYNHLYDFKNSNLNLY